MVYITQMPIKNDADKVVKKTFSLRPEVWSWLCTFKNKSEVVNNALEEYYVKNMEEEEMTLEIFQQRIDEYTKKYGYVSKEEEEELIKILDGLTDEDKELVEESSTTYIL